MLKNEKQPNLVRAVQKCQFHLVTIILNQEIDFCSLECKMWFAKLQLYFSNSRSVSYKISARYLPKFTLASTLQECGIKNVQILQIMTSQDVFFSVQSLQRVKELQMFKCKYESTFNLLFEDMSVPYSNTNFYLESSDSLSGIIQSAYQKYPDLFNLQCCRIHLKFFYRINIDELKHIQRIIPKAKLELSLLTPQNIGLNALQWLSMHDYRDEPLISRINRHQYRTNTIIAGKVRTKALQIFGLKEFSSNNLSKFQVTKEILFMHYEDKQILDFTIPLDESESKCECAPIMKFQSAGQKREMFLEVNELLNAFCKYEQVEEFSILEKDSEEEDRSKINELYQKLELFKNLRVLTLPLPGDVILANNLLKSLNSLSKLAYLKFLHQQKPESSGMIAQQISQYAIDNLKPLRMLDYNLHQPIQIVDIILSQRVLPLTIRIIINGYTQIVIDPRYGIRKSPRFSQY
ncbi:hypothetical protein FGO68_gene17779 [Halteria grandinella]|uniref:Uncharacterized protein n=1 Tax=Halteria grandinella TaxID=5974 RepID=A0A8J8NTY1_HALGN|nr:hypothetical protein FGO68_gene17779 [Halteria grandinella]